ncbi:MAG TPA: hypothetical protein VIR77_00640 [Pontiella sp.]
MQAVRSASRRIRFMMVGFSLPMIVAAAPGDADRFNYIIGTHTIGSNYQFTEKTRLMETAEAIRDMGSNMIKFRLSRDFGKRNYAGRYPGRYRTLTELAAREPSIRAVFEMPFYYYFMWVTPMQSVRWGDAEGYTEKDAATEYREIYDLAAHLLKTYNGTRKSFYFGHWEGDWLLVKGFDAIADPIPHRVENMIKWLNNRQQAVDDAKRDHPESDVRIFHYSEVNQVVKGVKGKPCYTTEVLPHVNVDYVSYSAYDAQDYPQYKLPKALDFIERHLPPKEGLSGKRVWVGEFGYKAKGNAPNEQKDRSLEFAKIAIEWGCPFVLYWQLYDNEFENSEYNGFWLINDKGEKQPMYHALQAYFASTRDYVTEHLASEGHVPSEAAFRSKAVRALKRAGEID